jgi:DNA-binding response OmpR family regulator
MKPKLLVVDDDDSVRESIRKLLEAEHYDVYAVRDGVAALDYFKCNSTDLVVLDVNLSADDGWEVFHTMTEVNSFVPTIIITAECDQRARAVTAGVEALIEKPIDVPAFLKVVSDLLAQFREQRLERACGDDRYCRYLPRHSEPFSKLLNERHTMPLELSSALRAALPPLLWADQISADGRNLIMSSHASDSRKRRTPMQTRSLTTKTRSIPPPAGEFC